MLPPYYPNSKTHPHHQRAEPPLCNTNAFLMPTGSSASLQDEYAQFFAPSDVYSQAGTLEAMLCQPVTAAAAAAQSADGGGQAGSSSASPVPQPRRRPFRTDRHSKIRTAQGVRDRRMRLSVGVARDFFALQDRLGFDKASSTVQWLLTQSKPAIDRLLDAPPGAAAPSDAAGSAMERGDASASSSTSACTKDSRAPPEGEYWAMTGYERSRWVAVSPAEERAGAAAPPPPPPPEAMMIQQPINMDGLDYYYQCYQLEEMMICDNGGLPR